MIKIVHLITGLETGGAERMLSHLVSRTNRDRFRSVVVSISAPGKMASAIVRANVELRSLGIRRGVADPRGLFRLDRVLREVRPEILQTWLYHADFLGLLVKQLGHIPHLIWNIRCSDASLSPADLGLRRLLSWCSSVPDAVIVNSRAGQRFHKGIGYRPRCWEYVPNGFDTDELRPDPEARRRIRAELGIDDETIVIGLAGALSSDEGSQDLSRGGGDLDRNAAGGSVRLARSGDRGIESCACESHRWPRNRRSHSTPRGA